MNKKQKLKKEINPEKTESKMPVWLKHPYLIIFCVAFIVYIRSAGFDFVYVDDNEIILDKYNKISSLSNVPEAFTSQYGFKESTPYYRPITNLSFFLDAQIAGKSPGWYHISNVIFHAIAVSLLFMVLLEFGVTKIISLFISLLFLVHPLLTNAVDWIAGRNDLIAGLFCLLAFLYFIKFVSFPSNKHLFLHSLFYLLGIFSKEVVLVLPVACVVYLFLFERKRMTKSILLKLAGMWSIPIIISQVLRLLYVNAIGNVTYGLPALAFNIRVIPDVLYKIFIPVNISVLPTFSNTRTIIGSGIFLLILLIPFLIRDIDKKRYYFGLFWFFLFLLPGLLVMYSNQSEGFDYLDTRNYIPMMGLIICAGVILSLLKIKKYNFKVLSFGFAILILLSVLTFIQSDNYRNAEVFAKNAVESNPERPFFYQKLADYYFSNKDYKKAIGYLKEIIQREPDSFFYYKNLALAYMRLNQSANALQVLEKAALLNDHDHDVLNAIIKISYELGRYKESLYYLNKAIENGGKVDPGFYESLKKLVSEQNEK